MFVLQYFVTSKCSFHNFVTSKMFFDISQIRPHMIAVADTCMAFLVVVGIQGQGISVAVAGFAMSIKTSTLRLTTG